MANPAKNPSGNNIPTIRARKDEIDCAFGLLASLQEMQKAEETMERRFRAIPYGWRNIRMMKSVMSKTIDDLLQTYPIEKLVSMQRMMPHMRYKIHYGATASKMDADECIVKEDNLNTLCVFAHEQCKLCIDQDCRRCKLGKTFDSVLMDDRDGRSWANIDIGRMANRA